MRETLLNIVLITIIWASLLAVLVVIAGFILPIVSGAIKSPVAGILRVVISLILFITWLAWWVSLAYFWFYRVLGGGRSRG